MNTYTLTSVKSTEVFTGTLHDAIVRALEIDADLQPAYGVDVIDAAGDILLTVDDECVETSIKGMGLVFAVKCKDPNTGASCYQDLYGNCPRWFTDRAEAQKWADDLSRTGEWPGGNPGYHVIEL